MDAAEFQAEGYLQEVNRLFFHPLGLKMAVDRHDDGTVTFAGVLDDRDDPEGVWFGGNAEQAKAQRVRALWNERFDARKSALGWMIEPVTGGIGPTDPDSEPT